MTMANFQTGYVVIYRNEDGTFSPGHYIHRERQCAIDAIPADENRHVLCVAEIHGVAFDRTAQLPIGGRAGYRLFRVTPKKAGAAA